MYKLVAIDLDGTLLNSYGEVSEKNKEAIQKAKNKGAEIVIASGRPISSARSYAYEVGADNYIICGNGSVLYDMKNEQIIYDKFIERQKALQIIKICEENSIYYNVYTNKTIIADGLRYNVLYYYKENLKKEDQKKTHITLVENIENYIKEMNEDEKIMKIFICDKNKTVFNSIVRKFSVIEDIDILDVSHMARKVIKQGTEDIPIEYYYTEISMKDVDKWYALEFLIKKLGIPKEEVMAIGDNVNDRKMIEEAGKGIVMGGSTPKVSEVADYITLDCNNEGVAKAIEKFIV